jgi:hypothetical protein
MSDPFTPEEQQMFRDKIVQINLRLDELLPAVNEHAKLINLRQQLEYICIDLWGEE